MSWQTTLVKCLQEKMKLELVIRKKWKTAWKDTDVDLSSVVVLQKLRNLKADKSPGPDGIHPMLLKSCAEAVAEPLSLI